MSTPTTYTSRDRGASLALIREGFAVALLMAGIVGLIVTGFLFGIREGIGVLSVVFIASGAALAYERDTGSTRR